MNRALLEKLVQKTDSALPIPLTKSANPRALVIDLNDCSLNTVEISQQYLNKYVGGPALAARLWACFANTEHDNPLIITGSRFGSLVTVAFRSPATGMLTFNNFPGQFSSSYCVVVVVGNLAKKGIIKLNGNKLDLVCNDDVNKLSAVEICKKYPGCIATGQAADSRIVYACGVFGDYTTGRGGLGCVMAEKNIKALGLEIIPTSRDTFDSASFVRSATTLGWAPVDNISKRTDPRLFHLCMAEKNRKLGNVQIPCQAILMLGSNIGCYDIAKVYQRYLYCLEKGLDPVSVGNILGWICQSQNSSVDLSENKNIFAFLDSVIGRESSVEVFADGLKAAAKFFNNEKTAKEINGLECGPYDYRGSLASAINDAFGNWFPVYLDLIPALRVKNKIKVAMYNEELVMGLQCMNINPDVVVPQMMENLSPLKKFLISHNLMGLDNLFDIEGLNITDVFTVGQNCRSIVRVINSAVEKHKEYIPDFFCIDPESNTKDSTIVDAKKLINAYKKALEDF